MTKVFVVLAILLILSGGLVIFGPQVEQVAATRSLAPEAGPLDSAVPNYVQKARELAEKANAPLSILFGLISLFYSRRTYTINRARLEAERARSA
jgi:uncharacterized iron-regulated membrane protein